MAYVWESAAQPSSSSQYATSPIHSPRDKLTISRHTKQPLVVVGMWMQRRPRRNMNLLSQTDGMILKQGLHMLPATQRADPAYALDRIHVIQRAASGVPVHRALHVRRLELAALHDDFAGAGDGALRDVEAVVVVFRETEDDGDIPLSCGGANLGHLFRVVCKRVLYVFRC